MEHQRIVDNLVNLAAEGKLDKEKLGLIGIDDVNAISSDGHTVLTKAAEKDKFTVVRHLLTIDGINVDYKVKPTETTALMYAANNGDIHTTELLLHHATVNLQNALGETALMIAVQERKEDVANMLLDFKANVNLQNALGQTALMIAASVADEHFHP